jgi:glycosyltransferase involved in cell wall biosynthesis
MGNQKISIIIPVYNVEKYLVKCLESVLSQTFTDFECILVDDCSSDNSPEICDKYAQNDSRIKVIHKKRNEGLPQARGTGFGESIGEYILFLDSDDWIESKMAERLYALAVIGNYDIVYCDADDFNDTEENGERAVRKHFDTRNMNKDDIMRNLIKYKYDCCVWNKLFKRELFKNIVFPKYQQWEDAVICVQLFLNAADIGYEYSILYHHRYNRDSLTWKDDAENRKRRQKETYNNWHDIQKILLRRDDYYKYKEAIERRLNNLPYQQSLIVKVLKYIIPYGIAEIYKKWKSK